MPNPSEILLDAAIERVLSKRAFRATLENGHALVAFRYGGEAAGEPELGPGDRVVVEMSPFDMSKGRIRGRKKTEFER